MEPDIRLVAVRVISQQVRHLSELLARAHALADDPPAGSAARADLDHINGHRSKRNVTGLRVWAHRAVALNAHAAHEHLEGVRAVLHSDGLLPLPAMALGRCVYEAVINTCWLVDVEVSTEQRLARWAGRLLHDGQEPATALDSFGEPTEAGESVRLRVVEARALAQNLMTKAGFELKAKGGARSEETAHVSYCGETSTLTPNVSQLVERFTPKQNQWQLFSGATHSRGWFIGGLEGTHTEIIQWIAMALLEASDALAVEGSRYIGLNPRAMAEHTHRNRVALWRQARNDSNPAAGLDAYRAAVNAWPFPQRD